MLKHREKAFYHEKREKTRKKSKSSISPRGSLRKALFTWMDRIKEHKSRHRERRGTQEPHTRGLPVPKSPSPRVFVPRNLLDFNLCIGLPVRLPSSPGGFNAGGRWLMNSPSTWPPDESGVCQTKPDQSGYHDAPPASFVAPCDQISRLVSFQTPTGPGSGLHDTDAGSASSHREDREFVHSARGWFDNAAS